MINEMFAKQQIAPGLFTKNIWNDLQMHIKRKKLE